MKKFLVSAAIIVGTLSLFSVGVSSAQASGAPSLPSNQHLYALDGDSQCGVLWSVNPSNGNSTRVGNIPPNGECFMSAAQNPVDGKVYLLNGSAFYSLDVSTGVETSIATLTGPAAGSWKFVITNSGQAFLTSGQTLYSLDLLTGATTSIGEIGRTVGAFAYNPVTDKIYVYEYSGEASEVNRSTGASTPVPAQNISLPSQYSLSCSGAPQNYGLETEDVKFDWSGNLWVENDDCRSSLLSGSGSTHTLSLRGPLNDTAQVLYSGRPLNEFYAYTLLITKDASSPTLANTGTNSSQLIQVGASGFAMILVGIFAMAFVRARAFKNQ